MPPSCFVCFPTAVLPSNQSPLFGGTLQHTYAYPFLFSISLHLTTPVTFLASSIPLVMNLFLLFCISFLLALPYCTNAQPSPGYYPSWRLRPVGFYHGFTNLWGPQHQWVSSDQSSLTIWLDRNSGATHFTLPLQTIYFIDSALVIILQTIIRKRVQVDSSISKWVFCCFNPTSEGLHRYPMRRFFVDDVPIRRYAKWSAWTFPRRPMWVYGSIWDASSWATDDGKYRADYRFQPFVARFTHFIARGCTAASPPSCRPPPSSPAGFGLSRLQRAAMEWAQRRSLVYDYCRDPKRDHSLTPECRRRPF